MSSSKTRVAILFGGRSCEHEVSVISARSLAAAIPRDRYDVILVGISKRGEWLTAGDAARMLAADTVVQGEHLPATLDYTTARGLIVGAPGFDSVSQAVDVIFPLLHGPFGEDGTVQGLLELADVAYVGAGVVGSAVGMDKELSRRVFMAEGLPQLAYSVVRRSRWEHERERVLGELEQALQYPVFVKPVSLGSSVGIGKAASRGELAAAVDTAAQFDYKMMVEAAASDCREVEVAVLGNEDPQASVPGEIIPGHEFYDYEAKYFDDSSELIIPARISAGTATRVRELAVRAFRAVEAAGLSRVDFFVSKTDDSVYLNEINTMPGFTPNSMYPKLWQASGIDYPELIHRLIQLALERQRDKQRTRTAL